MTTAKQNTPDNYTFGRPSTFDIKKYADDINEWSQLPEATSLRKWFIKCDLDPSYPPQWAESDPYFSKRYKIAKMRIAQRREEMLHGGEMEYAHYNRHQYFYEVSEDLEQERKEDKAHNRKKELMKYEAELKQQGVSEGKYSLEDFNSFVEQKKHSNATKDPNSV